MRKKDSPIDLHVSSEKKEFLMEFLTENGKQYRLNTITYSPSFENEVPKLEMMIAINKWLSSLVSQKRDNEELIQKIYSEMENYEIITVEDKGTILWVSKPIQKMIYTRTRKNWERIKHLFISKGFWVKKLQEKTNILILWETITVKKTSPTKRMINENDSRLSNTEKIIINLMYLSDLIKQRQHTSIFQKPDAIINRNILCSYLSKEGINNTNNQYPETNTLKDVISRAETTLI